MKQFDIVIQPREGKGSSLAKAARRAGLVPGVVYGAGEPNVHVAVTEKDFRAALRAGAAKSLVNLKWKDGGADTLAVIKEAQFDALGDDIQHVDFFRIVPDKPIHFTVPVVTRGKAVGESLGGVLEHISREVHVLCLPADIPEAIMIDLSPLGVGSAVHLRDLSPPPGVTYLDAPDMPIVACKASRMAKATTPEADAAEAAAAEAAAAEAAAAEIKEEAPAEKDRGRRKTER